VRVLVADDEKTIADSLAMILNAQGYAASAVYSGECAVTAAMELEPDVFISDVIMGQMTGLEAASQILKIAPHCRVLLVSGQMMTTDLLKEPELQGYRLEILAKPIHPKVLLEYLAQLP
jgi:CheY-like chemotaxis protein